MINKSRIPLMQIILLGFLPSFLKNIIYRYKFKKLGKNLKIGLGSVIIGEDITIGENVDIGFLTVIRGKHIEIEDNVSIGSMTFVDCPQIKIGYGARITEQVVVGGPESSDSKFVLGKNSIVMTRTVINPVCPVVIGDDTGIGGDSLVFSHSSWLNILDGYPIQYEPINIGNSVWIAWRVFVMPGTSIGDGTVIGANSLVKGTIPENCLAAGSPAKIISKSPNFPKKLSDDDKQDIFNEIIGKMADHFQFNNIRVNATHKQIECTYIKHNFFKAKKRLIMRVENQKIPDHYLENVQDVFHLLLSLETIPASVREELDVENISWIDIFNKEQSLFLNDLGMEVASYLRNYGIRLLPHQR